MFGVPKRARVGNEDVYVVELKNPVLLNLSIPQESQKLVPDSSMTSIFTSCRNTILKALCENTSLFRSAPTFASLDAITPPWGFVSTSSGIVLSPYTQITNQYPATYNGPVDFKLVEVTLSRSCIKPHFYVDAADGLIDLAFDAAEDELQEVSDVPDVEGGAGPVCLTDPARRLQQKNEEKERIRSMFAAATAEAERWYETYDVSDNESAFSDWLEEEDDEIQELE
jgi:hypothetical protein